MRFLAPKNKKKTKFGRPLNATMAALREWGLHLDDIAGQGYDGAASMSSERVGVQARIR